MVVDFVKPACRACQEDYAWLALKRMAQQPSFLLVRHVFEHHVQVLDDQHETPFFAIRELLQGTQAPLPERPVISYAPEFIESAAQVWLAFPARCLACQAGQTFEPELANRSDLIALLREHHREEPRREVIVPANLCGDPQQEARLAAAASSDHDLMNVCIPAAFAQHFQNRFVFFDPNAE